MLSRLKLAGKLMISFGLLNIIIIGLNSYTVVTGYRISDIVDGTLRAKNNEVKVGQITTEVHKTRTLVWQALATKDDQHWAATREQVVTVQTDLDALLASTLDPKRQAEIKGFQKAFDKYKDLLARLHDAADTADDLKAPAVAKLLEESRGVVHELLDSVAVMARDYSGARETRAAAAQGLIGDLKNYSYLIGALATLIGVLLWWLTSRSIASPIQRMCGVMTSLASGDFTVHVPERNRKDEIGEMAKAIDVFKDNGRQVEALRHDQEEAAARQARQRQADLAEMATQFENSVMGIVRTVSTSSSQMHEAAESLSSTARQTSDLAGGAAAASNQATANVQTVASAAEELSASIAEIGQQVGQADVISKKAVDEAHETGVLVKNLAETADKIGGVVQLINDIASQTNLLALNATIEAARAGEAGKGFAVVAGEVKNLANQTARATEEIAIQISGVQGNTKQAVDAIGRIQSTIEDVRGISSNIAQAVGQQSSATNEIAQNVSQAAVGTSEVSHNVDGVNSAASSTGAAAQEVLTASRGLAENASQLQSVVAAFIERLREEKKAVFMEWKPELSLGIPSIDAQHHKLVDMINELYDGFMSGRVDDSIGVVFTGLAEYAATHFAHEETVFAQTKYADTFAHKKEHDAFVSRVLSLKAKFDAGDRSILTQDLMLFLKNWLVKHIMGTDKKYVAHFKANNVG